MKLASPFAGLNAVLKATEKGDYGPLADRLRAMARGEAPLEPCVLNLAADKIKPLRRGPHTSPVQAYLVPAKALAVAGAVLRASHGYKRGEVADAIGKVASDNHRSAEWAKGQVTIARKHWGEDLWQFKCKKFRPK